MTVEERLERIEPVTAALVEERRKDREDYRQLWRDTQRQIGELSIRILDLGDELRESDQRLAQRIEETDKRLGERIGSLAAESREADKRLGERIDAMVSSIGDLLTRLGK